MKLQLNQRSKRRIWNVTQRGGTEKKDTANLIDSVIVLNDGIIMFTM